MLPHPVPLEIVTHVLGSLNYCPHCQVFIDHAGVGSQIKQADLDAYPPDFTAEWQRVSDWVLALAERYPGQLTIKITDAQSPQGLWHALRRGARRYPSFILAGKTYRGWESEADLLTRLSQLLERDEK
jgi:hypothetical protein